jgi:hypothetical protein
LPEIRIFEQGLESSPVVVIDDFLPDAEAVADAAAALHFSPGRAAFPGLQSPLAPEVSRPIWERLAPHVQQSFGFAGRLTRMSAYYSLITTPPEALEPVQRLPHFDGFGPFRIAVVHHLSRRPHGGTAFYRHRSTGFETIDASRLPAYQSAVNAELQRDGPPPAGYAAGDTPLYERIGEVEARFNRAVVYLGHALHSADVPADTPLLADPAAGRFSINTFAWAD